VFAKGEAFLKVLDPEAQMAPSERCKLDRGGRRGFSPFAWPVPLRSLTRDPYKSTTPKGQMSALGENRRIAVIATTCLAVLSLAGCGGDEDTVDPGSATSESALTLQEAQAPLNQGDPELSSIRDDANEILDEGTNGFDARLADLKAAGIPVVVNKWASWCGPCREEFPDFQSQAIERGDDVAFIGLLSNDGSDTGETFLAEFPTPYPSYLDSDQEIARDLGITQAFPTTLFIGSDGEVAFTKFGPYLSEDELATDIEKYAQ